MSNGSANGRTTSSTIYADRFCFAVHSLPTELRTPDLSVDTFRTKLKTFFYRAAWNADAV